MKEIKAIVEAYHKIDFSKNKAALATVVRVEGSSYRRTGARMLITDSGEWFGGISGGCLEGDALKKAKFAMAQNKATLVTYDTTEDDPYQIGVGLGCNGIIDVLLAPLDFNHMDNQVLSLQNCINSRTPKVIITVTKLKGHFNRIQLGQAFLYDEKQDLPLSFISENLMKDIHECLQNEKSESKTYTFEQGVEILRRVFKKLDNCENSAEKMENNENTKNSHSIKAILFDVDGVLVQNYFDGQKTFPNSIYFFEKYGITSNQTAEFYQKHLKHCVIGNSDIKEILPKYLSIYESYICCSFRNIIPK